MVQKEAKELLQLWIDERVAQGRCVLPEYDAVIYSKMNGNHKEDFTFGYIVRLAYLQPFPSPSQKKD